MRLCCASSTPAQDIIGLCHSDRILVTGRTAKPKYVLGTARIIFGFIRSTSFRCFKRGSPDSNSTPTRRAGPSGARRIFLLADPDSSPGEPCLAGRTEPGRRDRAEEDRGPDRRGRGLAEGCSIPSGDLVDSFLLGSLAAGTGLEEGIGLAGPAGRDLGSRRTQAAGRREVARRREVDLAWSPCRCLFFFFQMGNIRFEGKLVGWEARDVRKRRSESRGSGTEIGSVDEGEEKVTKEPKV